MTIIYRNDWNIKEKINYPLDFSKIDYKGIEYDPMGILIPIVDKTLQSDVCCLAEEIASWEDWCYPNNDETKTKLYVPMSLSSADFDPCLQIEAQPPKWTMKDVDGTFITEDMAYAAMDYHSDNDFGHFPKSYDIKLTTEEIKEISWIIISHLEDIISELEAEKRKAVTC